MIGLMHMSLSKEKRSFFMKCFIFSMSAVIALISAQMIMVVFVAILYAPYISNLPNFVSAVIFFIGIIITIYVSILCFKKISKYLQESQNIEGRNVKETTKSHRNY